jgi:hypothetical protein
MTVPLQYRNRSDWIGPRLLERQPDIRKSNMLTRKSCREGCGLRGFLTAGRKGHVLVPTLRAATVS